MEHPFGHSHHRNHRRNDDEEEEQRPPHFPTPPPPFAQPPPFYNPNEFSPPPPPPFAQPPSLYNPNDFSVPPPSHLHHAPPPPVTHVHRSGDEPEFNYQPPTQVSHVSHQEDPHHSSFKPHLPSFMHHHSSSASQLSNKPTFKVYCKAQPNFSLTIRDNKVLLAPSDPSDDFQHWYKDEKYSTRVKDEEGFPCFALVNKASGLAMKHSVGEAKPVQLLPHNPDVLDESVLWTESRDTGEGYRTIRMVNNIRLNVDAFNGDKKHGGVRDGTTIVLWQWKKGDNQRWKIVPYCKFLTNIMRGIECSNMSLFVRNYRHCKH